MKVPVRAAALLLIGTGLAVGLLSLSACRMSEAHAAVPTPAPTRDAILVRTAAVERREIAPAIRASGFVLAKENATLSFKVGGIVARVLVHPGDTVHAGQLLATLDTAEIDANVQQAEAAFEKATRDHGRAKMLFAGRAIPQAGVDDAATGLRVAAQNLSIARFNREHATLVAAGAGRVSRRLVEPNSVVGPGTPVLQVQIAGSGFVVRAGVIDRDVVRVGPHSAATVTLDAFPGQSFPAHVTEIGVEPSPLSGVYDVELKLDSPPARLISGLVAKVDLPPVRAERLAIVPIEALTEGDGHRASVYVVSPDSHVRKTAIETAFLVGREVAVRAGLDGVERVVVEGAPFLNDGAVVREVAP